MKSIIFFAFFLNIRAFGQVPPSNNNPKLICTITPGASLFYAYEALATKTVDKITVMAGFTRTIPPDVCVLAVLSIGLYNAKGELLSEKQGSPFLLTTLPKTWEGYFLIEIKLPSPVVIQKGWYYVGYNATDYRLMSDLSRRDPLCTGFRGGGMSELTLLGEEVYDRINCDPSKNKSHYYFASPTKNFPRQLPVDKTDVPCNYDVSLQNPWTTFPRFRVPAGSF